MTRRWTEWDFDNPCHRSRVEVLPPERDVPRLGIIEVHHHRGSPFVVMMILGLIMMIIGSPGACIMIMALILYWI